MFRLIAAVLLCITSWGIARGHTMWLETIQNGAKGTPHKVHLFFGEFSMADRTPLSGWLADMDKGRWEVLSPSGKVITLSPTPSDSCYTSTFVPEEDGWYRIHYDCWVPQLWNGLKLHYQSITWVRVGSSPNGLHASSPFDQGLSFGPYIKPSEAQSLQCNSPIPISSNKNDLKGVKINILGDNGWSKNYYRFPDGQIHFSPLWHGEYLINSTQTRALTEAEKSLFPQARSVYDMITYYIEV